MKARCNGACAQAENAEIYSWNILRMEYIVHLYSCTKYMAARGRPRSLCLYIYTSIRVEHTGKFIVERLNIDSQERRLANEIFCSEMSSH